VSRAEPLPRNATRVRLVLDPVADSVVQRALERSIRHAIGDPAAVVGYCSTDDGEDLVITVKQEHGTWWTIDRRLQRHLHPALAREHAAQGRR
jgi:hypothetical protein